MAPAETRTASPSNSAVIAEVRRFIADPFLGGKTCTRF
jgi:hypothetical protein